MILDESDDEFFGDGEEDALSKADFNSEGRKLYQSGYREGKQFTQDQLLQQNFDLGFGQGMRIGRILGRILAHVCESLVGCDIRDVDSLKQVILKGLAEDGRLTRTGLESMNQTVKRLNNEALSKLWAVDYCTLEAFCSD